MSHTRIAVLFALAVLALPCLAAVSGSVMSPDGVPIAGARVSIYALESGEARRVRLLSEQPEAMPGASTQTDSKGTFSLASPKEPVTELRVTMKGYAPVSRRIESSEESLVIVLQKAETKSGTITAQGKPVEGAVIAITYGGAELVLKSDAAGRYEAPELRSATGITVIHRDYAIDDEGLFSMSGSIPASKLNRSLAKGTAITGRVTSADGKSGIAGAAITVSGWPLATSGEDGSFTITRAPARWDTVIARKDALIAQRQATRESSYTLRLDRGATLSGRILDAKTKTPLAGAFVRLGTRRFEMRPDAPLSMIVDAKGTYTFVVPAGTYTVSASHPAYDLENVEAGVANGQTTTRDLSLQPLARVSGVVVDESNRPIAAATIAAEDVGDSFAMRGRFMMRDGASSASGPDGKFTLRMPGDRDVKIRASKRGLPAGRSDAMKPAAGERKSGVVISMPSGIEVTGKVTDAEGTALSGALVSAAETAGRGGAGAQRMMVMIGGPSRDDDAVQTASDGTFTMRLKEGVYDLSAKREGYSAKTVRALTVSPNGTSPVEVRLDPAVEISGRVVRGGTGVEGVNVLSLSMGGSNSTAITGPDGSFTLSGLSPGQIGTMISKPTDFIQEQRMLTAPARDVVIELPAGSRVSGRVVEKGTRRPITAFEAGITRSGSGGPMMMMGPPQTKAFTSDDGSFVLDNVPTGAITVTADAPGFVSTRLNVTVEEGKPLEDLVLELDSGVKLTGRVTGPNGGALSDVTVMLAPSTTGGFAMRGSEKRAMTDSSGEYVLDGLTPGEETISFSHAKYLGQSKQVTLKGREMKLDVQLEAGSRLSGIVVTEAGAPVADAEVRAMSPAGASRTATTNASGQFEMDSLTPARYRFTASRAGYSDGVVEDFDIASGASLRIVMKTGGTIYGRVTGLTEQELANAFVMARAGANFAQTPVDSTGNFRLEGAPTGNVQVSASTRAIANNRSTATQTVSLSPGASVQVDLAFRSDVVIRGRVTRNGRPLAAGSLMFLPRAGGASAGTSIDEQGNYSMSGLEDGQYTVTVIDMQRLSPYTTNYEVRGSGTFDIDYTTAAVRGRVIDVANSRPLSGATVNLRATGTIEMFRARSAVTDENGTFALDSVPAGAYTLTASLDTYGSDSREIVVSESQGSDVELRLARNDGITLKVVDARDNRSLSANATVFNGEGRVVQETRGPFLFGGDPGATDVRLAVAPGQYIATVYTQNYAPVHVPVTSPSTRTIALTPGGRIEIESKHSQTRRVQLIDGLGIAYPRIGPLPRRYELVAGTITPLERIAPGRYTLQLLGPDDTTVIDQVQVVVVDGQTVRVEI